MTPFWRRSRDPVERQLQDIARQGTWMSTAAHLCAFLMLLLFSAGSLVALAGAAVEEIARGHVTIPNAIAVGVSTLLVACMDTGMLYAASMIRLLSARRAEKASMRGHRFVLFGVAVLEASTYAYMSWRYEAPNDPVAWALVLLRALAAPFLSVYLSLARPLPVTARDILYQVELAVGLGVIRDAVTTANDHGAPLAEKMDLFRASSIMSPSDGGRLDGMIDVLERRGRKPSPELPPPTPSYREGRPRREAFLNVAELDPAITVEIRDGALPGSAQNGAQTRRRGKRARSIVPAAILKQKRREADQRIRQEYLDGRVTELKAAHPEWTASAILREIGGKEQDVRDAVTRWEIRQREASRKASRGGE